jgi:hypothetical protein
VWCEAEDGGLISGANNILFITPLPELGRRETETPKFTIANNGDSTI